MTDDPLVIGRYRFRSRLIVGTGKYPDPETMVRALDASGADMVTVAVRRVDVSDRSDANWFTRIDRSRYTVLPNTAGCYTAEEAVRTARLAREALDTDLVKLEVIGDQKTLFPDNRGLLVAAETLVAEGFTVMPYTSDDPVVCRLLQEIGCSVVMPLAAPIGSGLGVRNPYNLRIIMEQARVPVIVDAGVGTASDCAVAMELGADGLLVNTAIACAKDPVAMATALRLATEAGRLASKAGRIQRRLHASASSPIDGLIE